MFACLIIFFYFNHSTERRLNFKSHNFLPLITLALTISAHFCVITIDPKQVDLKPVMFALMLDNNNQAQVRASLAVRHRPQPRSRSDRSFPPFFPFFSSVVLHLMLNTIAAKKECHSQQPTTTRSAFGAHHKRHLRTDCSLRAHTLSLTLVVFSVRDSLGQFLDFFTLSQTIFGRLIADRVPSYTSLISFSLSSRCR